nr:NADH dehydrogenase subunit 5 [Punctum randolphii]
MSLSKHRLPILLWGLMIISFLCLYSLFKVVGTVVIEFNLMTISSMSFSVAIIFDKISISFGYVVLIISACVFTFACNYMSEDPFFNRFMWLLLSFVLSMNLLIYSGSVIFLLLGWDGLGVTSFALIIYYSSKESLGAGFLTMGVNRLGDVIIMSTMVLFIFSGQFLIFPVYSSMLLLISVMCVAGLTKSAQYPFSPWLPAAMAAPTPVSALVHSSTLVTAGIYLIIRLCINLPLSESAHSMLCFCGSITSLLGGAAAVCENDLKKIIALSTLSQLGVMMFSLGMGFPYMALFHLYTHAMFKALLFLAAGVILMMSFGTQDVRLLGGLLQTSPVVSSFFMISSLCLIGAPFMSSFYSKHVIIELMVSSSLNVFSFFIMLLATFLTSIYVIRSLKIFSWNKRACSVSAYSLSLMNFLPLLILGVMGILSGKLYYSLEYMSNNSIFIPNWFSGLFNVIIIVSLIIGYMMISLKSFSLAELFFTASVAKLVVNPLSYISLSMKNLDYGWLSPSYLFSNLIYLTSSMSYNFIVWPYNNMVIRSVLFILCLLVLL